MSQWNADDRRSRVCLIPIPRMPRWGPKAREAGSYLSGALFAIGWWFFIDSVVYSKNWDYDRDGGKLSSIEFVDWVPGICSTLGLIIINCVDKASLTGDSFSFSDSGSVSVQWIARLFLFIGFSFMAGGLAGSISVMCLKYIIPDHGEVYTFWGICNVVQNAAIMLSAAVLWFTQNSSSEEEYNFSI